VASSIATVTQEQRVLPLVASALYANGIIKHCRQVIALDTRSFGLDRHDWLAPRGDLVELGFAQWTLIRHVSPAQYARAAELVLAVVETGRLA